MTKLTDAEIIERQKTRERVFELIQQECVRQDMKWGDQSHDDGKWLQILIEELGENSKHSLEEDRENARNELIQCSAVLAQWICDSVRRQKSREDFEKFWGEND